MEGTDAKASQKWPWRLLLVYSKNTVCARSCQCPLPRLIYNTLPAMKNMVSLERGIRRDSVISMEAKKIEPPFDEVVQAGRGNLVSPLGEGRQFVSRILCWSRFREWWVRASGVRCSGFLVASTLAWIRGWWLTCSTCGDAVCSHVSSTWIQHSWGHIQEMYRSHCWGS